MRKLSKTLTLVGLLTPLGVNALGIGEIQLNSALNQTLSALIPLQATSGEDVDEVKVYLASPEAFAKAGIERHYSLTKLRFTPEKKPDGNFVIQVSSTESIREPFLNFIIELHWPQGRMQREFTVLLDPPSSGGNSADAIEELPEAESVYQRSYEPQQYVRPRTPSARVRPIRQARVQDGEYIEPKNPVETPARAEPVTGTEYGPIARNETLWSIAQRNNHDETVSQKRMMTALYKANPHAFHRNNINALKTGASITIPDHDSIIRLTGEPSGRLVNPRKPLGHEIARNQIEETALPNKDSGESTQGQLKLLAPTESKSKDDISSLSGKARSGKQKDEGGTDTATETMRRDNEEIRKQLSEFQQQLSNMQRMLVLKDEQIAALQAANTNNKQSGKQLQGTQQEPVPSQPIPRPTPPLRQGH